MQINNLCTGSLAEDGAKKKSWKKENKREGGGERDDHNPIPPSATVLPAGARSQANRLKEVETA